MAGHVENRGVKGAPRYVAVWKDPLTGKRRAKSFERKRDAEAHLARTGSAILDGAYVSPDAGRITVGEYVEAWVDTRFGMGRIKVTTRDRYRREAKYLDTLAAMPLARLTPSVLEQWQVYLLRTLEPSTVATVRAGLSAALRTAVRDKLIGENPLGLVDKPRSPRGKVEPLTLDQVEAIRDGIAAWYSAAVMLGAGAGLRRGEAFGLTLDRVDFLRRTITVDRQLIRTKADGLIFGSPKTESSKRVVPAPDAVLEALAAHVARFGRGRDELLFQTRGGRPVDAGILGDAFRRVGPPGARFHDLRHFYASALIAAGADVLEVQERLGHATPTETLNTYGHLWPGSEDTTRKRIDGLFARPAPAASTASV